MLKRESHWPQALLGFAEHSQFGQGWLVSGVYFVNIDLIIEHLSHAKWGASNSVHDQSHLSSLHNQEFDLTRQQTSSRWLESLPQLFLSGFEQRLDMGHLLGVGQVVLSNA